MKKIYRILFSLLMTAVLALAACGGSPAQTADGTYVKPVEPSEGTPAPSQQTTTAAPQPASTEAPGTEAPASTEPAAPETTAPPAVISTGLAPGEGVTAEAPDETTAAPDESPAQPGESTEAAPGGETAGPAAPGTFEEDDLTFTYKGKTIRVGEAFVYADFEDAWGSPRIEKAQACIGGGFDENYYFGDHLTVFTLGDSGEQEIYDIYIDETGFATAKGAEIGSTTREDLHRIYGDPEGSFGRSDRYSAGDTLATFTFENDILTGIDYNRTQN